jgi:large subunit ribosomal protein L15
MRLHELSPNPGSKHRTKRLGCGESSGHGKTSGKGHKGQKARAGGTVRVGFEGGQMPLYRRVPRRGFNQARFQDAIAIVNLSSLEKKFNAGEEVNEASLREKGLVQGRIDKVKVLSNGTLSKALKITVSAVSASAKEKIEQAGGSVTIA